MKIVAALLVFIGILMLCYMMASFFYLSFDPHKWEDIGRYAVGVFGGFVATALGLATFFNYNNKK